MPRLTRRIESRGYEMDARQRVSPAVLARYCEHVRWQSLSDPTFGLAPLFEGGRKIVVRAQCLEVGVPLVQDQELELDLDVAQVGNTSLKFLQHVTRVRDGALVARAVITAVALDASGRPAPVPDSIRARASGEPVDVPSIPERAEASVWSRSWLVRPSDLDTLLHMNQSRYVELVDDVRELCARAQGYGAVSEAARRVPTRIVVDYRRETRAGTELTVLTWASAPSVLGFELVDPESGAAVARARIDLPA